MTIGLADRVSAGDFVRLVYTGVADVHRAAARVLDLRRGLEVVESGALGPEVAYFDAIVTRVQGDATLRHMLNGPNLVSGDETLMFVHAIQRDPVSLPRLAWARVVDGTGAVIDRGLVRTGQAVREARTAVVDAVDDVLPGGIGVTIGGVGLVLVVVLVVWIVVSLRRAT